MNLERRVWTVDIGVYAFCGKEVPVVYWYEKKGRQVSKPQFEFQKWKQFLI